MNNELAKLIKTSRIKNQLSQRELAKKMKVSNTIISRIESGMVKKPSLEIIIKLSNELKIEFHNLAKISGYSNDEIFPIVTSEDVNLYSFYNECYVSLVDFRKLEQENKRLKDNWNKLKEWFKYNVDKPNIKFILETMQELEQGDDK